MDDNKKKIQTHICVYKLYTTKRKMCKNKTLLIFNIILAIIILLGILGISFILLCRKFDICDDDNCFYSGRCSPDSNNEKWIQNRRDENQKMIDRICGFDENPVETGDQTGNLLWLGLVFHHGDRTPFNTTNLGLWNDLDGTVKLTDSGKQRMFCYGEVIRRRYRNFVGK